MKAIEVYAGSDGELTKRFYAQLVSRGPIGLIAMNLFRAQKCSARAKVYRGGISGRGSYKAMAYERKSWSMGLLVEILSQHAGALGITYGWKRDEGVVFNDQPSWVLYIDLPGQGQVSFHSPTRGLGPDYLADFCGVHASAERIIVFCDAVMRL